MVIWYSELLKAKECTNSKLLEHSVNTREAKGWSRRFLQFLEEHLAVVWLATQKEQKRVSQLLSGYRWQKEAVDQIYHRKQNENYLGCRASQHPLWKCKGHI